MSIPKESSGAHQTIPVTNLDDSELLSKVQASIKNRSRPFVASSLKFSELFDLKEIQEIQNAFALATGVASIITKPDGTPITQPSNFCRLCKDIIRQTEKGLKNCIHSDAVIGRNNPSGPIMQPCLSAGLWDGGASINVEGVHIANWLIGQVRNEEQNDKDMLAYAREIGANEVEYSEALNEITEMSSERFAAVCNALFLMSNLMSNIAYQNLQQGRLIIQLKQTEQSLLNVQVDLEERVEDRTKDLKQSYDELQKTQEQLIESEKMAALAMLVVGMSHEINTPLGVCVTSTSLLQDNISKLAAALENNTLQCNETEGLVEDAQQALTILLSSLDSAVALMQSFKQISADQLYEESVEFDVMEHLQSVYLSLATQLQNKSIRLEIIGPTKLIINGYPGIVMQIITGLVNNSIEHGFKNTSHGVVTVHAELQGNQLQIDCEDNGCGIDADYLPQIFNPFYTTRRRLGNTGLGLYIIHNLVTQKLKGNIRCISESHKGAKFRILFPAMSDVA